MRLHPLDAWLLNHRMTMIDFSRVNKRPFRALYDQTDPQKISNPSMAVMQSIEDGTGGEVTVQMQSDWAREKNAGLRAGARR